MNQLDAEALALIQQKGCPSCIEAQQAMMASNAAQQQQLQEQQRHQDYSILHDTTSWKQAVHGSAQRECPLRHHCTCSWRTIIAALSLHQPVVITTSWQLDSFNTNQDDKRAEVSVTSPSSREHRCGVSVHLQCTIQHNLILLVQSLRSCSGVLTTPYWDGQ
jgi:hypothetical protein